MIPSPTRWLVLLAAPGLVLGYLALQFAGSQPSPNASRRADPAQFRAGKLNADAVRQAHDFSEFPLVWLGEEFEGFRLTDFVRLKSPHQNAVALIYGDCQPDPGMDEPSCVPPLTIMTSAPGSVPGPEQVEPGAAGALTTLRGVQARTLSGSYFLWTVGVVITVHASPDLAQEAIQQLETANHAAMGRPAVRAGESLKALGQ